MSTEQNKELVRQLIEEVFNQGNADLVFELLAADFVEREELPPGLPTGRDGVIASTAMLHSAFPDFKATIDELIAEDDKVAARLTWSGTQQGEFMGVPPSGKHFTINVFDMFRIADGRIAEHWGQMDTMGMMMQLGAMPGPE